MSSIAFSWRETGVPVRVLLHVDGVHDHHIPDLHRMTRTDGVWTTTLELPDDLVSSYRIIALDAAAAARFDATADSRRRWLDAVTHVVAHRLEHPGWRAPLSAGASGRLILADAPAEPGWVEGDPVDWERTELDGRTLWTAGLRHAEHLLVISDGQAWSATSLPAALARLGSIGVVAVDTAEDRVALLTRSQAYRDLIADQVLPWVRQIADVPAGRTVIAGESLGGLAALDVALQRPDAASRAVATSGSFWAADVAGEIRASGAPDGLRVHVSAGRGEGRSMVGHARAVADALRAAGVPASLEIGTHGHEMAAWTGALTRGLVQVLG